MIYAYKLTDTLYKGFIFYKNENGTPYLSFPEEFTYVVSFIYEKPFGADWHISRMDTIILENFKNTEHDVAPKFSTLIKYIPEIIHKFFCTYPVIFDVVEEYKSSPRNSEPIKTSLNVSGVQGTTISEKDLKIFNHSLDIIRLSDNLFYVHDYTVDNFNPLFAKETAIFLSTTNVPNCYKYKKFDFNTLHTKEFEEVDGVSDACKEKIDMMMSEDIEVGGWRQASFTIPEK